MSSETYWVRTYFKNTEGQQINNAGGIPVTPDEIWIFGSVSFDTNLSAVVWQGEWVYGLPSNTGSTNPQGAWESALGAEINLDQNVDGQFESKSAYDYTLTYAANPMGSSQMTHEIELYRDGDETLAANNWSTVSSRLSRPLRIGEPLNLTFTDTLVVTRSGTRTGTGSGGRIQFHAKGIGLVEEIWDNYVDDPVFNCESRLAAIYIRINGIENGSLSGTPFEPGGSSAGLWFE